MTNDSDADVTIRRSSLDSPEARQLIGALNVELSQQYPEEGATNFRLDGAEVAAGRGAFLVAYRSDRPVGCGALRRIDARTGEIKRMYVVPDERGRKIGAAMVAALEEEARARGITRLVLETGVRQLAALSLYARTGFSSIPPYGEYVGSPLSVCLAKEL